MERLRYFYVYRCLQVLNLHRQELTRSRIATFLASLALIMIGTLFITCRGGIRGYPFLLNGSIVTITVLIASSLFVGGKIYFFFCSRMELESRSCWKHDMGMTHWSSRSRADDKAFIRSCRPICVYIGDFLPINDPGITLNFYGNLIVINTINLLVTLS